jgi:gluconolactonase
MFRSLVCTSLVATVLATSSSVTPPAGAEDPKLPMTLGSIDSKDPKFDALIPKGSKIEVLAGGFKWTEGPVWDKKTNSLLFSDIPNNRVVRWSAKDGVKDFLKPSGYTGKEEFKGTEPGSNGLAFDKDGNLILCQHGDRRVAKLSKDGKSFETLADKYMGKRLNSPNDLVFAKNGDMYFTDPPYGLPGDVLDPKNPHKELDFQGVYKLTPKGELTLLTKEMTKPNGIALSPDEKTLYVANSDPAKAIWMAFPVNADGTLGKGKELYDATKDVKDTRAMKGLPDGMKVDKDGNIFATAVNGVYVFSPDGKLLGRIVTNDKTANCNWGDDGTVLYLATNDKLTRIKTGTKGLGW